jgi:CRISPR type III-A-associated RAMP protein Csm4
MIASFSDGISQERWSGPLKGALRLLADSGFGGGRSRGWGRSEMPEIIEGDLPGLLVNPTGDADGYWLLSVFHPAASDVIDWRHGNYSLSTRGGRVESGGDEKKPTRMLTEGSVIVSASAPVGAVSDVAPENFAHPVYRSGFALAIPIPLVPLARPA